MKKQLLILILQRIIYTKEMNMKKIMISTAIMLFCCVFTGRALDTKLVDYNLNMQGFLDYDVYGGKIALLTDKASNPKLYYIPIVIILENGEWIKLPINIGSDTLNTVNISSNSQIHFDSTGNIWICGSKLFKYDGQQWTGYGIEGDAYEDKRVFKHFCVDKYNNIWVTSIIYSDSADHRSELLKFDGEKFSSVLKFNNTINCSGYSEYMMPYVLAASPDGKVVFHGMFPVFDKEFEDGNFRDVFIINQDMTYERLKMPSTSGAGFDGYIKAVSSIFTEPGGKTWFTLGINTGSFELNPVGLCCSGMAMYDGSQWTLFNESNNLDTVSKNLYEPIYRMAKLTNGDYFLVGKNMYYIMGSDYKLKKYFWEDFFNKSDFIICHSYFNGEKGYEFLGRFLNNPPLAGTNAEIGYVHVKNNKIYIGMDKGIIIANESSVLSVPGTDVPDMEIQTFPNPTGDNVFINANRNYTTYRIVNIMGREVAAGEFTSGSIPVSTLPSGVYIIRLTGENNEFSYTRFIKE